MASYRGHLTFSTGLGIAYGGASWWFLQVDPALAGVAGVLTALGGLLPDLDSDSGVPVREMFNLAATLLPLMELRRLASLGLSAEEMLLAFAGLYAFVRFGVRTIFKHLTVHRGMFHSVPAMLIVGLLVYLGYHHPNPGIRGYLAFGTMLGFLSHLVLDELCSVDFRGVAPKLNQFAGTALKLRSPSFVANVFTYTLLGGLGYLAYGEFQDQRSSLPHPATAGLLQHEREPMKFADRPGRTPGPRRAEVPASIPSRLQ
jgi:LexA-binding, inner membrane-associated putative hydrolase